MEQSKINRIRDLQREYSNIRSEAEKKERRLRAELAALYKECDHKHPDGSSAIVNGFLESHCDLCDWSDL